MVPLARTRRRTKAGCDWFRSLEPDAEPKRVHDGVEASAGVAALRRRGTAAKGHQLNPTNDSDSVWFQPRRDFHLEKKVPFQRWAGSSKNACMSEKLQLRCAKLQSPYLSTPHVIQDRAATTGASPPLPRPRGVLLRADPAVFNNQSPRLTANADAGI